MAEVWESNCISACVVLFIVLIATNLSKITYSFSSLLGSSRLGTVQNTYVGRLELKVTHH